MRNSIKATFYILLFIGFSKSSYAQFFDYNDKQELMKALEFYNYPDTSYIRPSLSAFDRKLYDKEAKDKLLILFQNKWTKDEEEAWVKHTVRKNLKGKYGLEDVATRVSQEKKKSYDHVMDSLVQRERENVKIYLSRRKVQPDAIRLLGLLDDPSFIPYLKNALDDPLHYDPSLVKLSLARLKASPFHDELIKVHSYATQKGKQSPLDELFRYQDAMAALTFICSQESILEFSKWLKSKTITRPYPDADDVKVPLGNFVIDDLRGIVLNEEFKNIFSSNEWHTPKKESIESALKWLAKNYGKYELRR
ncbi:MAG: hypothetical protein ACK5SL_07815 [Cyclobacteriaceae bacterium]